MDRYDVYLYGMTLLTASHLIKGEFPKPDTYCEIMKSYTLPGGETGNCAIVLSNLGVSVKVDGNHLGRNTYGKIKDFFDGLSIDMTAMTYDSKYEGLEDCVFIDKSTRTCFGRFHAYYSDSEYRRWNTPRREDIETAGVIGIDPFFFDESVLAARYCRELGKKYVTIDCKYDSEIHKYSAVNVVSNEFIRNNYEGISIEELFHEYTSNSDSLVIFTFGAKDILYGRRGERIKRFSPYKVDVVSTLGAGDTFKAGAIYALFKGMSDEKIVSFASAAAAAACSSFPLALNPPTLDKISALFGDCGSV